jgi:hypothetical protein
MRFNLDQNSALFRAARRRRSSGLTLVEIAVAAGIGSMILLLVGFLSLYAVRSFATIGNSSILSAKNRIALDRMARDIRQMDRVQYCYQDDTVKWIKFTTKDPSVPYLKYLWYPGERKVICERQNQTDQTILTECDQWDFVMYQDLPIRNSPNSFRAVTNAADCRMVEFKWAVSRSVLGKEWSGERVQSSRFVLRNR